MGARGHGTAIAACQRNAKSTCRGFSRVYLSFKRLAFLFLAVFAVLVACIIVFHIYWKEPGERCEAQGGWYDIEARVCATPIYIPDITGRQPGESREDASRRNAAELVELERQVAAQRAARDAAVRAQQEQMREARNAPAND